MLAFGAYVLSGVRISYRMSKEGKEGPPWGLAAFRKDSYTPEGQRLLTELWYHFMLFPFVIIGIFLGSAILCSWFK